MAIDRRRTNSQYLPLRDAMERLFEGSVITPQALWSQGGAGFPPADMHVTDNDVIVHMSIPGAKPDDINISVTGDTLTVSGHVRHESHFPQSSGKQQEQQSQGPQQTQRQGQRQGQTYFQEIWQGSFERTFSLPTEVDANKASASYDNGILTLTLPKSEATKPRKIQVTSGQSSKSTNQNTIESEKVPVKGGSSS